MCVATILASTSAKLIESSSRTHPLLASLPVSYTHLDVYKRQIVVFGLMLPFDLKLNQKWLVSWGGLRGAAAIAFATVSYTHLQVFLNASNVAVLCI